MEMKLLYLVDDMTKIPVFAWRADVSNLDPEHREREREMLATAGFGRIPSDQRAGYVFMSRMDADRHDNGAPYDRFRWTNRTLWTAHTVLGELDVWNALSTGDTLDVRGHPRVLTSYRP